MGWVMTYIDDVESDLSAFHRVDDWRAMPSRRFVRLAERLPYYRGTCRARAEAQADEHHRAADQGTWRPGKDGSRARSTPVEFTPGARAITRVRATQEPYDIAAKIAEIERRSRGD